MEPKRSKINVEKALQFNNFSKASWSDFFGFDWEAPKARMWANAGAAWQGRIEEGYEVKNLV